MRLTRTFRSTLDNASDDGVKNLELFFQSGDESILAPHHRLALLHIKSTQLKQLPPSDIDFLIHTVCGRNQSHSNDALVILVGLDDNVLTRLTTVYDQLTGDTQRTLIMLFAGTPSEVASRFLFHLLETVDDDYMVEVLILSLSKSIHAIFTICFFALQTASFQYRARMQTLLKKMGLDYALPYLLALPTIPEIEFFTFIYGADTIKKIQTRKFKQ